MEDERDLNIVLVGLDSDYIQKVAQQLAEQFDMYYLDSMELYRFDISPYTLSFVLKKYGMEYFREKQTDTMKYVASFSNTIITVESGALLYQKNLDILTKDAIIVYIKIDENKLYKRLQAKDYRSREELSFYCLNKRELIERDQVLTNISQVVVDGNSYSEKQCVEDVTLAIQKFYGVV